MVWTHDVPLGESLTMLLLFADYARKAVTWSCYSKTAESQHPAGSIQAKSLLLCLGTVQHIDTPFPFVTQGIFSPHVTPGNSPHFTTWALLSQAHPHGSGLLKFQILFSIADNKYIAVASIRRLPPCHQTHRYISCKSILCTFYLLKHGCFSTYRLTVVLSEVQLMSWLFRMIW